MYRDWNIKLKDALEQIYKNKEFIDIMDHIENASVVINGDSKVKEIEKNINLLQNRAQSKWIPQRKTPSW